MIFLPYGWAPSQQTPAAATPTAAGVTPPAETCAENVARVQAEAVAKHAVSGACAWCCRSASSAACTCKELCDAYDCEAGGPTRGWKGPEFMREKYGMVKFQ